MRASQLFVIATLVACGGDDHQATTDAPSGVDAMVITAPPDQWTWIEMPGTTCGNGTPAGFGINFPPNPSDDLLVYFEGGGACWDDVTCFTLKSAVNIDTPYTAAQFANEGGKTPPDRSAGNVFGQATLVWIPYCTGDLHAGITTRDYAAGHTVHHTGATNTQTFVDALHTTLPNLSRIWISGSSAGGFGATFNQHRFAAAWPSVDIHVLQDSSPFVPVIAAYATWQTAWTLQFPPNCTGCDTSLPNVIDTIATAHPNARIGLLTYDDDAVIRQYFGYPGSMVPATNDLLANQYGRANTHAFVLAGTSHTMLGSAASLSTPSGVKLADWITQWANGDAAWTTAR